MSTLSPSSQTSSSWWESLSLARTRISLLSSLLTPHSNTISDSDNPALSLLTSHTLYSSFLKSLYATSFSGSADDPLCHWLYDTYLTNDLNLRLVVLSYVPVVCNLYMSRLSEAPQRSLAGFEAVLLAIYADQVKSRGGRPVLVSVPDLSRPSLYHNPNPGSSPSSTSKSGSVGVISPPLEPQTAVKSTKRPCIVGVALDCYFKQISQMPFWSKLDLCKFVSKWAGQDCPCKDEFDQVGDEKNLREIACLGENMHSLEIVENGYSFGINREMGSLQIRENDGNGENWENGDNGVDLGTKGARIPLPWEILQPLLRILGHCLLGPLNVAEVKEAAGLAVRCLYARASHDLAPQAILATRSLIQLDKSFREAERAAVVACASSNVNTPSKEKKPEMLLVSKYGRAEAARDIHTLPLSRPHYPFRPPGFQAGLSRFHDTFLNTHAVHSAVTADIFTSMHHSGLDFRYATISDGLPIAFYRTDEETYDAALLYVFGAHAEEAVVKIVAKGDPKVPKTKNYSGC